MEYLWCKDCKDFTVPRPKNHCTKCKCEVKESLARSHRGVAILTISDIRPGSNLTELKSGGFKDRLPDYNLLFSYKGGFPEYSKKKVIESIDDLYRKCVTEQVGPNPITDEDFKLAMNS